MPLLFRAGVCLMLFFIFSGCIVSADPRILDETRNVPPENTPVNVPVVINSPTPPSSDDNLFQPPATPSITPPIIPSVKEPVTITLSKTEVAKHSIKKNCWVIYASSVYNISAYTTHPGGSVYVPYCGKDMTKAFDNQGHSAKADKIVAGFLLGKVGETIPVSSV